MTAEAFYQYLIQARRRLWAALDALPDEELSRPVMPSGVFRSIKDFLIHIVEVEDGWFRGDLLGAPLVLSELCQGADLTADGWWRQQGRTLDALLTYWNAVEQDTLARWPELGRLAGQGRRIGVDESRPETISADEVLWHVMQHEVRHTAQIVLLMRLLGHKPPALDLVFLNAQAPGEVGQG